MPLPTPTAEEKETAFVGRCMADAKMLREYPTQNQRAAVCHAQWRNSMEELMENVSTYAAINGRVLHSAGIISDVSVISEGEARGHDTWIDGETLSGVKACLDAMPSGVKVKINHFSGFDGIVGTLRDARLSGDRLRADLHLLNEHPARDLVLELAARQPDTFGLSIAFSGRKEKKGVKMYARCTELYSVDLVDAPAANPTGLFSQPFDSKRSLNMLEELKQLLGFAQKADTTLTKLDQLAEKLTTLEAANKDLQTKLSSANQTITTLEAKTTDAEKQAAEAKAKADADSAAAKKQADELAAKKALEITGAQGQAPVGSGTAGGAGSGGGDLEKQLMAIADPVQRTLFYRAHEKEIKAARHAQRAGHR